MHEHVKKVRKGVRIFIRIDISKRLQKNTCARWVKKCAVARNSGSVVPLLGNKREFLLGRCPTARYVRLPGCPEICPAVRLPGNMPGCPEICPVARKYARLPGNMPGCPVCPAARYTRLPGNMPGCPEICPVARYARLPGMSGCPEICPAARKYTRLPGNMPGCPEICPAAQMPGTMPGTMPGNMPGCPVCPAARNYARLPGTMPGNMPGMSGSPASALQLRSDAQRLLSAAPLAGV